jgi:hypothetical protein
MGKDLQTTKARNMTGLSNVLTELNNGIVQQVSLSRKLSSWWIEMVILIFLKKTSNNF